ncbi:carboxymuconolactone decarboxylase family protein [Micromonospora eburnea]|uniref:Alkylhydroperoxidase AhpD family core domain-containing protein n=1 Tax=Micromonospora eburnea TaxID=227316 RepID=A0A1C6UTZ4_9ACTN|nr:carboxymuconolactone decarboxylase family protein [Micromonospora eburnea]SCL57471.1 alkylhydroperoxidase AhpD family core domain-containing protein [Micromonospora eburnea]
MGTLLARLTRRVTQSHIEHLSAVPARAAPGLVRHVYRRLEREFGLLAPPVTLHAAAPALLAACWLMLREALLADGPVGRDTREAVAAAVSLANRCPYCVEVHGSALRGLLRGPDAGAVADDRLAEITEPRLREIVEWFRHDGDAPGVRPPRLDAAELAQLVGVAVLFHYLNRMVNVFLAPSPLPVALPPAAERAARWLAAVTMGRLARRGGDAGADLDLLPPAPVPPDLAWARADSTLATAFARACAAVDEAAERAVPPSVRGLLLDLLAGPAGLRAVSDRATLEAALDDLPAEDRAAGRLALTVAFFSYRVTDAMVAGYRLDEPADRRLLELVSWASLTAARAAGSRLYAAWHAGHGQPPGQGRAG